MRVPPPHTAAPSATPAHHPSKHRPPQAVVGRVCSTHLKTADDSTLPRSALSLSFSSLLSRMSSAASLPPNPLCGIGLVLEDSPDGPLVRSLNPLGAAALSKADILPNGSIRSLPSF
jgi:hypothetical protein